MAVIPLSTGLFPVGRVVTVKGPYIFVRGMGLCNAIGGEGFIRLPIAPEGMSCRALSAYIGVQVQGLKD